MAGLEEPEEYEEITNLDDGLTEEELAEEVDGKYTRKKTNTCFPF